SSLVDQERHSSTHYRPRKRHLFALATGFAAWAHNVYRLLDGTTLSDYVQQAQQQGRSRAQARAEFFEIARQQYTEIVTAAHTARQIAETYQRLGRRLDPRSTNQFTIAVEAVRVIDANGQSSIRYVITNNQDGRLPRG